MVTCNFAGVDGFDEDGNNTCFDVRNSAVMERSSQLMSFTLTSAPKLG